MLPSEDDDETNRNLNLTHYDDYNNENYENNNNEDFVDVDMLD